MDNSGDNSAALRVPLTGGLVALVSPEDRHLATMAWHVHPRGRRRSLYACHAAWRAGRAIHVPMHHYVLAPRLGLEVDHVNGDSLDNRRGNLRHLTHQVNVRRAMHALDRMHVLGSPRSRLR